MKYRTPAAPYRRARKRAAAVLLLAALLVAGLLLVRNSFPAATGRADRVTEEWAAAGHVAQASFGLCQDRFDGNCVIDGDTIRYRGERIRLEDIDAPETHPPRCEAERELGERATRRLLELVNQGPFAVVAAGDRDRYGRALGRLERGGKSLGAILVAEGLARRWDGRRHPWC
jgi:micrococcal nuclease